MVKSIQKMIEGKKIEKRGIKVEPEAKIEVRSEPDANREVNESKIKVKNQL